MRKPILFKISSPNFALESSWNNSGQAYLKRIVFLSIMYYIMDDLKYSVTFTLNVHTFGSMRKQNIEEPLPWLRSTCGVGLIADITVFCWIVCSFEMEFELVTIVTELFCTYLDGVFWTQFFCYICGRDVGRVEHLGFLMILGNVKHIVSPKWPISLFCNQWFVTETSSGKEEFI